MDLVSPLSDVVVASPPHDPAGSRSERLAPARDALLGCVPLAGRSFSDRKMRRKLLELRPRLLAILERVIEKGSDRHVQLVLDAVTLHTTSEGRDVGGAEALVDCLRGDPTLYDDGDDWLAGVQRLEMMPVLFLTMVGFSAMPILMFLTRGVELTYWLALFGGTLGCFLDWNRSEPRKTSGSLFQQLLLRGFQPLTSAIYGLITVLLLRSGIVNLRPANVSEPVYLFLAAVLAGYGGQHGSETMQRLTKALNRSE